MQESHRQLFANSIEELQQEILRITGRAVREPAAETETHSGSIVHAFTTGAVVQVFLLAPAAGDANGPGAAADAPAPRLAVGTQ